MNAQRTIVESIRLAMARLEREEDGPTAAEYAVMLAVIAGAALVGFSTFGEGVYGLYLAIDGALTLT